MTPIDYGSYVNQMLVVVVPALAILIVTALGYVTLLLKRKMEASTAVDKDALLKSVSKQAVFAVEEASKRLEDSTGKPMSGKVKASEAAVYVQKVLPDASLTQVPMAVQAQVGATLGVGASKETGELVVVPADVCKFPVVGKVEVKR